MRTLRRIRQKMYYSLPINPEPVYETDENGNIIYIDVDGEQVPVACGYTSNTFSEPVGFRASICSKLNEMHLKAYGVSQDGILAEICVTKGYLPLVFGSKIWKSSEIKYDDNHMPIVDSADYTVVGILDEFPNYDWYLLQRINNAQADIQGKANEQGSDEVITEP